MAIVLRDLPFYKSDFHIVVADPHRPGHELTYHPGEANARMADVFVLNKVDTADPEGILTVRESLRQLNPDALMIEAGPTLTHGEMAYGAGWVAARRFGAAEIVDPRPFAVGSIVDTYNKYPTTGNVLPAMGYGEKQMKELEQTIANADVDLVIVGTPIDLTRIIEIKQPYQRVRYELQEIGKPNLADLLEEKFGRK